mmetsp:Transcript_19821/g.49956  ORF Transcript_19821/g.49956 Transcript_19821/m.49956 type:complete len:217 (-) Transcript_19821:259-909(-)
MLLDAIRRERPSANTARQEARCSNCGRRSCSAECGFCVPMLVSAFQQVVFLACSTVGRRRRRTAATRSGFAPCFFGVPRSTRSTWRHRRSSVTNAVLVGHYRCCRRAVILLLPPRQRRRLASVFPFQHLRSSPCPICFEHSLLQILRLVAEEVPIRVAVAEARLETAGVVVTGRRSANEGLHARLPVKRKRTREETTTANVASHVAGRHDGRLARR